MKSNWEEKNGFLEKLFIFSDFQEALNFVNKIGAIAEEAKTLLFALTRKAREQTGSMATTQI